MKTQCKQCNITMKPDNNHKDLGKFILLRCPKCNSITIKWK